MSWKPAIVPSRLMTSARDQQGAIDDALGAENDRDVRLRGGRCNGGPGAFEERRVGRRHRLAHAPVAGNEAFRKADEAGALDGCLRDGLFGQRDRLLGSRREADVGEGDSKHFAIGSPDFILIPEAQRAAAALMH